MQAGNTQLENILLIQKNPVLSNTIVYYETYEQVSAVGMAVGRVMGVAVGLFKMS